MIGRPLLRSWLLTGVVGVAFAAVALVIASYYDSSFGTTRAMLGTIAALIPLGIVVPTFLWLDRFEAEPTRYLLFAFLWGALVAAFVAAVLNTSAMAVLKASMMQDEAMAATAVLVAPVVEESLKGLGVLVILLTRRREFDGITDGMVYAGLVASGFAFTENIQYLAVAESEGGREAFAATFVLRCLFTPFAHPMFTVLTGIGLGVASSSRRWPVRLLAPALGLALAMLAHGLFNLSSVAGGQGFLAIYLLVAVPVFIAFVCLIVWARRREGRLISQYLLPYAQVGWFTPAEIAMLGSMPGRRHARTWARLNGGSAALRSMRRFQDSASELALLRHRMSHHAADAQALDTERALLTELRDSRARFLTTPSHPALTP